MLRERQRYLIQHGGRRKRLTGWVEVLFQQCKDHMGKVRFDLGREGRWVSVLCLKSRSSCKRKRPVGYCGSIVQEGHSLGNTDEGVIRVQVIGKDIFPVTHMTCPLVKKNS